MITVSLLRKKQTFLPLFFVFYVENWSKFRFLWLFLFLRTFQYLTDNEMKRLSCSRFIITSERQTGVADILVLMVSAAEFPAWLSHGRARRACLTHVGSAASLNQLVWITTNNQLPISETSCCQRRRACSRSICSKTGARLMLTWPSRCFLIII